MRGSRTRFASGLASPALSEVEARRAWLRLLDRAKVISQRVRDGGRAEPLDEMELGGAVRHLRAPFPLQRPSFVSAGEAFLVLAKGFAESGCPAAVADFVHAGADCLERILIADGHARASAERRRLGEDD